jgi:hypothetical protein
MSKISSMIWRIANADKGKKGSVTNDNDYDLTTLIPNDGTGDQRAITSL